jgi:PAS domain S-box-containing protein/excisionase family DNA binding protein
MSDCPYYTIAQAMAILGVSRSTLWRWIRSGKLTAYKAGLRSTRIKRADLEAVLRRRTTSESDQASALLETIFDTAPIGLAFWDTELRCVRLNQRLADINGLSIEAHLGRTFVELLPGLVGIDQMMERWREIIRTGRSLLDVEVSGETLAAPGKLRYWSASWYPVRLAGRIIGMTSVVEEITERRHAEAALRDSEARLRAVWESASDAIVLSDPDGTVLAANPAYHRLMGYEPEQVIGQSFALIFPEEQRAQATEQYRAVFAADELVPAFETVIRRADGAEVPVEARYDFVLQDSRRSAMVSMVRDISDRRALERMQHEFLSMIGHELMNPLNGIRLQAEVLRMTERYRQASVDAIIGQVDLLGRLIRDLTDVSRLDEGRLPLEPAPMDLVDVVRACAEQARGLSHNHSIRIVSPDAPIIGVWDRHRLEEVIANLVVNAIKYSPAGGEVCVSVGRRAGEALVSVRDPGIGIAPDRLPRLFDRFYRVRDTAAAAGGLGLGLYISQHLIQAHGGRIWAESAGRGQGSTFSFTLPQAGPENATSPLTIAQD